MRQQPARASRTRVRFLIGRWQRAVAAWRALPTKVRRVSAALGVVLGASAVMAAMAPSWVRSLVAQRAADRGLVVEVGGVRPSARGITLTRVSIVDPTLPGTRADIDRLELRFSLRDPLPVFVEGVRVVLVGEPGVLNERLRTFRGTRLGAPAAASAPERSRGVTFSGVDVAWRTRENAAPGLVIWGMRGERQPGAEGRVHADLARISTHGLLADVQTLDLTAEASTSRLKHVDAVRVFARADLSGDVGDREVAQVPPRSRADAKLSVRALWAAFTDSMSQQTTPEFRAVAAALTLDVVRGRESLRIGPNRWSMTRSDEWLTVMGQPATDAQSGAPLTLKLRAPLSGGLAELDVRGGPVSLASLGVREGDFGLVRVREALLEAEAHVVLTPPEGPIDVTTRGRLDNVTLNRPALAASELSGINLGWSLEGSANLASPAVHLRAGEVSLGALRASLKGKLERTAERTLLNLQGEVPIAACGSVLEATPRGAAPLLSGVSMDGTFSLAARLAFDSSQPDATSVGLDVANACRIRQVPPAINPRRFSRPFLREVRGADGLPLTIESGPGTPDWTPYEDISPHLETAVLVCEDAGFFRHRGFAYRAIESSIRMNLISRRFVRGASTISMQLAKNLYLGQEKTLSRKLQEAVLTQLLEQELSKHEIMELYLNVIEFGPGIYGIKQAARYYFNEQPRDLSLGQALYLASILPNPDAQHFLPDGRVSGGWSRYLQKLMHIAFDIQRISKDELEAALSEQVAFGQPNTLRLPLSVEPDLDEPTELPFSP